MFVFLAGVLSVFFYLNKPYEFNRQNTVVKSVQHKYDNPTLVLDDGSMVSLEPKKKRLFLKTGLFQM